MQDTKVNKEGLIYLASPYSHEYPGIREKRFKEVCMIAGNLIKAGYQVFSPIAHTHPIAVHASLELDFNAWIKFDTLILEKSDFFIIALMSGWVNSTGVRKEIEIAGELGKPTFMLPTELENFPKFIPVVF